VWRTWIPAFAGMTSNSSGVSGGLGLSREWSVAVVASGLIFCFWVGGAGWSWEGYPCFYWDAPAGVRYLFLGGYLVALTVFLDALRRSAVDPGLLDGGNILAAFVCFVLLRIVLACSFPLVGDEAYYWLWSAKIDWCYYDHPALVAWVSWPFRMISASVLSARAGPVVLGTISSVLIWYLAAVVCGDRRDANRVLAIAMMIPVGFVGTVVLFNDAVLAVFWLGAVWFFIQAIKVGKLRYWMGLGAALGLAFHSKFLAFGLVLYLGGVVLVFRSVRSRLRTAGPYLALAIAAGVFTPVILWNAAHEWQTFWFNFVARPAKLGFSPTGFFVFTVRQLALAGPVFLVWAFVFPAVVTFRRSSPRRVELGTVFACSWVPFVLYGLLKGFRAPYSTTTLNWTGPLYPLLVIIFVCYCRSKPRTAWLGAVLYSSAAVTIAASAGLMGSVMLGPQASRKILASVIDNRKRIDHNMAKSFAWPALARELDALYEKFNSDHRTFVCARDYMDASALNQYCRKVGFVLSLGYDKIYGRAFDEWNLEHSRRGDNCLAVAYRYLSRPNLDALKKSFERVRVLKEHERVGNDPLARLFRIYLCENMTTFPISTEAKRR